MPRGEGWCKQCRVEPAADGRSTCEPCAERRREEDAALRARRRRRKLCLTCGEGAAKGRRYCAEHLAYYAARAARAKAAR